MIHGKSTSENKYLHTDSAHTRAQMNEQTNIEPSLLFALVNLLFWIGRGFFT